MPYKSGTDYGAICNLTSKSVLNKRRLGWISAHNFYKNLGLGQAAKSKIYEIDNDLLLLLESEFDVSYTGDIPTISVKGDAQPARDERFVRRAVGKEVGGNNAQKRASSFLGKEYKRFLKSREILIKYIKPEYLKPDPHTLINLEIRSWLKDVFYGWMWYVDFYEVGEVTLKGETLILKADSMTCDFCERFFDDAFDKQTRSLILATVVDN